MCRLLMMNKEGAEMLERNIGVRRMLEHLEAQCGGHGNGLFLTKGGKVTFMKKGTTYSSKKIAKKILESDFDYAGFHTRVASVGKIKDSNCHPYISKKKDFVLMMNGTEHQYGALASELGITDTELIFRVMLQNDVPPSALEGLSSRFMGFKNGKVFICNSKYAGLEFVRDKNAFIVASSFPKFVYSEAMEDGLWTQGETILKKKYTAATQYGSAWSNVKSICTPSYKSTKDEEVQALRALQEKDKERSAVQEYDYDNWEEYQTALSYQR